SAPAAGPFGPVPGSGRLVQRQLAGDAGAPAIGAGLEDRAPGHGGLVDVQRHRYLRIAGVADGVVLVRRDQAAGRAGAGQDGVHHLEAVAVAVLLARLVLGDLQLAGPDALDAPQAAMVVHRGALARAPGHGHHAVAGALAAVELTAGIVAADR